MPVASRSRNIVLALTLGAASCVTMPSAPGGLAGSYRYELWGDRWNDHGALLIGGEPGAADCVFTSETMGVLPVVRCDFDQSKFVLTVATQGPMIRIRAHQSGDQLKGRWVVGPRSGMFQARRDGLYASGLLRSVRSPWAATPVR